MVEWKKLVAVSDVLYGYPFESSQFSEDSTYMPLIRIRDVKPAKASTYYSGEFNEAYRIKKGDILVGMDGEFNLGKWDDRDGLLNQRVLKLKGKDGYSIDGYLFHYMGPVFKKIEKETAGGSVKHLSAKVINSILIPIPSLEEQTRIVGILDTFTSAIDNLKEQIAQRRKQYEYYRDQLLDLEGKPGVEMKTLGEVCEISGDYGLSAPSKPYDGVRYLRITDITDSGGLNNEYVSADLKEDAGKEPLVDGDILFARTGATVGKTLVYRSNFGKCLFAGYLIRYRARKQVVFPQYLFHFTHSTKYYNWVSASLAVGAQPNISAQRYNQLQFPLPPLSEQQRIVSILDTFEASIQNLEAQLEQREKQYEYYRNKLLTFEE